ncbi:MAG: ABC transporter [Actinobacteria bacterium]|nr:MAG: ABC transporter [Actinomycetota bacterium]
MNINHNAKGAYVIWLRELKRYWVDKPRIISSLAQPLLFLFILGTGLSRIGSSKLGIEFIFPGIIGMTLLFTSIFSAVSIVWDREFGFLKEVLVAPVSRTAVAIGKALGGASVAMIQGTLILLLAPFIGVVLNPIILIKLWSFMFLIAFSINSLGLIVAVRMKTMEGFQMVMNFFLFPMFLLSGALFPITSLPGWLSYLVRANPLTYGVDLLRQTLLGPHVAVFSPYFDLGFLICFAIIAISVAVIMFRTTE